MSHPLNPKGPYTSGHLAKLFVVSPRTVNKWIDAGLMPGSYRLPLGIDRRVPREGVMKFLEDHPDLPRPSLFIEDAGTV